MVTPNSSRPKSKTDDPKTYIAHKHCLKGDHVFQHRTYRESQTEVKREKMAAYHFIFFPCPLEVHSTVLTSLDHGPAAPSGLHVAVHLFEHRHANHTHRHVLERIEPTNHLT